MNLRVVILLLTLTSAPACGGGAREAAERELASLRTELVKLRAETAALSERVDGLELRGGPRAAPATTPKGSDRPQLEVVRLAPDGSPDDPGAEGPRTVIRSSGKGAVVEDASDVATFNRAEAYLAKGDTRRAIEQYEALLDGFPQSGKIPDALLSLSKAYGKIGDAARAEQTKKTLLFQFSSSDAAKKVAASK